MSNNTNHEGRRRSGSRFGGNRQGGKPSFGGKSWGDKRSDDRPTVMHKATCSNCGKPCEVPFRPVDGKPVYCKDCFGEKGRSATSGGYPKRDFDKRGFTPAPKFGGGKPSFDRGERSERGGGSDLAAKQLEAVNGKLERLIQAVEKLSFSIAENVTPVTKEVEAKPAVSKKVTKKKAAKK